MKKKIIFSTLTLLLILGIAQVASAAGWVGGPWLLDSANLVNPVETYNMTDEQVSKIQQIQSDTYQETRDLRVKMMDSMYQLRELQLQEKPDQAKIDAKIKEINDLRTKLYDIGQQSREESLSLFTDEQLADMYRSGGYGMGRGMGMGHGPGFGFRGGFGGPILNQ